MLNRTPVQRAATFGTEMLRQLSGSAREGTTAGPRSEVHRADVSAPATTDTIRTLQASSASILQPAATFTGSTETWLGSLADGACTELTAVQRAAILQQVDADKPEMLRRLLCTPMASPETDRAVARMADLIAPAVLQGLPRPLPPLLHGEQLEQAAQHMLAVIQSRLGTPAELALSRVSWEKLGPETLARYTHMPSEQSGIPASERLAVNSECLTRGMAPDLLANALTHELTHKYQYLQRDALEVLDRTGLSSQALLAMDPAQRLHAVRKAWPAGEDRALLNTSLLLLFSAESLAVARLNSACIDSQQTLSGIPQARRGSVMEQMAYALGNAVQRRMQNPAATASH